MLDPHAAAPQASALRATTPQGDASQADAPLPSAPQGVTDLQAARQRRAHRAAVAHAIAADAAHELQGVAWPQLVELPDWCLWADGPRSALVRVAGALFCAPGMRLWIDGSRLGAARAIVGSDLFERVMQAPALPMQAPSVPASGDLSRLFDTAGRAVLLGSLAHPWMRSFAAPRLPLADAQVALCPPRVAQPLAEQALQLLEDAHR